VIGDDGNDNPTAVGGGSGHVNTPYIITPLHGIQMRAGSGVDVSYANSGSISNAVNIAKNANVAIVFVACDSSEGSDRPNLSLPGNQDALVEAVAQAQPNTIVVIHSPGAVLMPWANKISSIVAAFLPGQEDGNAIASILFGDVNPSARLPVTFPMTQDQIPVNTPIQYPGINGQTEYSEKLLVGYRWYDAKNVAPLFPFGHGLSYTTFEYSNLTVTGSGRQGSIRFNVRNSGKVAGSEVPQLYLGYPLSAGEPPKVLRGFQKITLTPGQSQSVSFTLGTRDVSIWDVVKHDWASVSGTFDVLVGASSRDIRLRGTINN
jgi:beta-glucosidase